MAVLKADPEYRRKSLVICVLFLVFGAVLAIVLSEWGIPAFEEYLKGKKPEEAFRILQWLLVACFFSMIPWAFYIFRYARRILNSGQFPPPGTKVIRDTQIIEGQTARRYAYIMIAYSVVLVTMAILAFYIIYLLGNLIDKDRAPKKVPRVSQVKSTAGYYIHG